MSDTFANAKSERLLLRLFVAAASVMLAFGVGLGGGAVLLSGKAKAQRAEATRHEGRIGEIRGLLREVEDQPPVSIAQGFSGAVAFQGIAEAAARKAGCVLADFRSNSDEMPFSSGYGASAPDVRQVEVQLQLEGTLPQILDAMRLWVDASSVPIEIQLIELSRADVDAEGRSRLAAKVRVQVLSVHKELSS
jgi:hypothetical protein